MNDGKIKENTMNFLYDIMKNNSNLKTTTTTYAHVDIMAQVDLIVCLLCLRYLRLTQLELLEQEGVVLGESRVPLFSQLFEAWLLMLCILVQIVERVEVIDCEVRDALYSVHDLGDGLLEFDNFRAVLAHVHRLHFGRVGEQVYDFSVDKDFRVGQVQVSLSIRS